MAGGKRPVFRIVIGKRNIATLWTAQSKGGLNYHSGTLDVTNLRAAIREATLKKASVRVDKSGRTEEHDVCRLAMFDATIPAKVGASKSPSDDF